MGPRDAHAARRRDAALTRPPNYSTFLAETASITNEMLLNDYMVAHAKTEGREALVFGQGLELIRTTFFRQTMFAEFQLAIHEAAREGRGALGRPMTEIYRGLLKKYYGDAQGAMKIDPAYCMEWAFIPHFYYGFYVYQYATSMAGAARSPTRSSTRARGARPLHRHAESRRLGLSVHAL